MEERRGYRPIADYAAIGDCSGGALVARDGGIDWCCLERFDADPVFCRLLDAGRGGFLEVRPVEAHETTRAYLPGTNVLRTELRTARGRLELVDFMPVGRNATARANDYVDVRSPGWLARRIECIEGSVPLEIVVRPSVELARRPATLHADGGGVRIEGARTRIACDIPLRVEGDRARGEATLRAGERRYVALVRGGEAVDGEAIDRALAVTRAFWSEWIGYCRYRGPYREPVERSALALKMLSYPATGACVAALTTSLPEEIGGKRNWDYRFCWIRDTSLVLHALSSLGYASEADRFFDFICRAMANGVEKLQVLYGVGREADVDELSLGHLDGYSASRPVRVGNAACRQRQIDLYGHVLEGALVYRRLGGKISRDDAEALARIADFIGECWKEPDTGLWEVRGPMRHFVHSKAMCWVVLDRAIRLFGARQGWLSLRDHIWSVVVSRGRHPSGGYLLQAMGEEGRDDVDAALLQLCALGLPLDEHMLRATRAEIERRLARDGFLQRYTHEDGVGGHDGAFLVCSFWLVDALLAEGELARATALFERLLACANDVGLYSEEIDPGSGAFLGNFPQAFTHLGLVNTAISLDLCRRKGAAALRGGYADRARRSVYATFGWPGVAAALLTTGRIRVVSSRESKWQFDPR